MVILPFSPTACAVMTTMMVVLTSFPLTRGSVDSDDIIGREIGRQGTGTSSYVYTIDWCVVVAL